MTLQSHENLLRIDQLFHGIPVKHLKNGEIKVQINQYHRINIDTCDMIVISQDKIYTPGHYSL